MVAKTPYNLTPREGDTDGLSFSLTPPLTGKYVVTTIEAVNMTGVLTAVNDRPNHVSVRPTNFSAMPSWIASKQNANIAPHPLTITLRSIVWVSF